MSQRDSALCVTASKIGAATAYYGAAAGVIKTELDGGLVP